MPGDRQTTLPGREAGQGGLAGRQGGPPASRTSRPQVAPARGSGVSVPLVPRTSFDPRPGLDPADRGMIGERRWLRTRRARTTLAEDVNRQVPAPDGTTPTRPT